MKKEIGRAQAEEAKRSWNGKGGLEQRDEWEGEEKGRE